jgi:hypothetical protein
VSFNEIITVVFLVVIVLPVLVGCLLGTYQALVTFH